MPSAEHEIKIVQELVPTNDSVVLKREEATKQNVLNVLSSATHIHFACHGGASFLGPLFSAALSLSGQELLSLSGQELLSALEIARLSIPARLVVASACETGVLQGYEEADESLSLASAFIAAGAAGVVSTLWSVDDFATALVITRFYEGLFGESKSPTAALREAQLWMRDADDDVIDAYVSSRPPLRALRGGRGASTELAYTAPFYWAAFVFSGA